MAESGTSQSSISKSNSLEEMSEFWDTHELSDFEAAYPDVTDQFEISIGTVQHRVAIDPDILRDAAAAAHERRISVQTLVNLAVRQALTSKP